MLVLSFSIISYKLVAPHQLRNAYDVVKTASKLVNQPFTGNLGRDAKYFGRFKHLSLPVPG